MRGVTFICRRAGFQPARTRGLRAAGLGLLVVFGLLVPAPSAVAQTPPPKLPATEVVVLVDESGSLGPDGVAAEKEAARTVALSILGEGSTITVVGFGSSERAGQSPVDLVCGGDPAVVDTAEQRNSVASCVDGIHERTDAEGNNTDHVAALKQALGMLSRNDAPKVVFLMTDGELDVPNSEEYGRNLGNPARTAQARKQAALDEVPIVLDKLTAAGAQVWPLGFGNANPEELGRFAAGNGCSSSVPSPAARVISKLSDLADAIVKAFGAATCAATPPIVPGSVASGNTTQLQVEIPPIASDSAILVYKQRPEIRVNYLPPATDLDGQPVKDLQSAGSSVQISGQNTGLESLRVVDPVPGTWTVELISAPGVPDLDVGARVVYQGAVSVRLSVTPPQPQAGQQVDIAMQLRTRRGGVTDPALLQGLTFNAGLTANGKKLPEQTLTDADNDATFEGTMVVPPDATGDLAFTAEVTGPGIGGGQQTFNTQVQTRSPTLSGQLVLDPAVRSIEPGSSWSGEARVTNSSGMPKRLRLVLVDPTPGSAMTVDPAVIDVGASGETTTPFVVRFGPNSALGGAQGTLQLVDDADPSQVIALQLFAVQVAPPPTWLERFWWVLVAIAALLAAVVIFLAMRAKAARDRKRVRGLRAHLLRDGALMHELHPPRPQDMVFRFTVHNDGFTDPQLVPAGPGQPAYQLRRDGAGVALARPDGTETPLELGQPRAVEQNLALVVFDDSGPSGGAAQPTAVSPAASSWDGGGGNPWAGDSGVSGWGASRDPVSGPAPGGASPAATWTDDNPWGVDPSPAGPQQSNRNSTDPDAVPEQSWNPDDTWGTSAGSGSADPHNPWAR